jgi:hypothetical protein
VSNLRQIGTAIQMYVNDNGDYLPGPCWTGMFFTYSDNHAPVDPYSGSLAAFLTPYLGYPPPSPLLLRTALVAVCPASKLMLPNNVTPIPPLNEPVSYFSQAVITNDPPTGNDIIIYPFGRPASAIDPAACKKHGSIKHPSDTWAMMDCDKQLLDSLQITSTYYNYVALLPVHSSGKSPARRNRLYYDWSVHTIATPE